MRNKRAIKNGVQSASGPLLAIPFHKLVPPSSSAKIERPSVSAVSSF